jgi:hypothetical protein
MEPLERDHRLVGFRYFGARSKRDNGPRKRFPKATIDPRQLHAPDHAKADSVLQFALPRWILPD